MLGFPGIPPGGAFRASRDWVAILGVKRRANVLCPFGARKQISAAQSSLTSTSGAFSKIVLVHVVVLETASRGDLNPGEIVLVLLLVLDIEDLIDV